MPSPGQRAFYVEPGVDITADYKYLVEEKYFTAKQIYQRAFAWVDLIDTFVDRCGLAKVVYVDPERLMFMVLCYFSDIARLKKFHNIDTTNEVKIFSYSFYWLLRTTPVQITDDLPEEQRVWLPINEELMLHIMWECKFLQTLSAKESLKERYMKELRYFFKYRPYTAQTIEAMLNALLVGAGKDPFDEEPTPQ
jgi:hypothetical protein